MAEHMKEREMLRELIGYFRSHVGSIDSIIVYRNNADLPSFTSLPIPVWSWIRILPL
jgi:hypothetical protein